MNVILFGKNAQDLEPVLGFTVDAQPTDVVISYGGDGTLLAAERKYPSIPKLPIRDSKTCKKCANHTDETMLRALLAGKLQKQVYPKLAATYQNERLLALNDVVIRNKLPMHATRFYLKVNGKQINDLIIGDGVVAATAFGATGYYHSVSRHIFNEGFGIAFNNPVHQLNPLRFSETDTVEITVIRGPATLSVDNNPTMHELREDETVKIKVAKKTTTIYAYETLRCKDCVVEKDKRLG